MRCAEQWRILRECSQELTELSPHARCGIFHVNLSYRQRRRGGLRLPRHGPTGSLQLRFVLNAMHHNIWALALGTVTQIDREKLLIAAFSRDLPTGEVGC